MNISVVSHAPITRRLFSLGTALSLLATGCRQEDRVAASHPVSRIIGAAELNKLRPEPLLQKTICITGEVTLVRREVICERSGKNSFLTTAKSHYLVTQVEQGKTNVVHVEHNWSSRSPQSISKTDIETEVAKYSFLTNDQITGTWELVPGTRNFYLYSHDNISGLGRYDNRQLFSSRAQTLSKSP